MQLHLIMFCKKCTIANLLRNSSKSVQACKEVSPFYNSVQILTDISLSGQNLFCSLLCYSTLMREKRAHYVHWCSWNACLFSVFYTICLASHTQSHGHGRLLCQAYLFMRLNQACNGQRIPSAGAPATFLEWQGPESSIAVTLHHTRDTRRVATVTHWEVRGPTWEVRETQWDERESIWTSDLT